MVITLTGFLGLRLALAGPAKPHLLAARTRRIPLAEFGAALLLYLAVRRIRRIA